MAANNLLKSGVDDIRKHCVLYVSKHIERGPFYHYMFPLRDETRQKFAEPFHAIRYVEYMMHFRFHVIFVQSAIHFQMLGDQLSQRSDVRHCIFGAHLQNPDDVVQLCECFKFCRNECLGKDIQKQMKHRHHC